MQEYRSEPTGARRRRFRLGLLGGLVLDGFVLAIVDLWLLVAIGRSIGALPVVLFLIAEAAVGTWCIRRRWRTVWTRVSRSSQDQAGAADLLGKAEPVRDVVDTVLVVAGGLALIFPGVITALLGVLLVVPVTRRLPARMLRGTIERRIPGLGDLGGFSGFGRRGSAGDVIEGEVVEDPGGERRHGDRSGSSGGSNAPITIRGEVTEGPESQ